MALPNQELLRKKSIELHPVTRAVAGSDVIVRSLVDLVEEHKLVLHQQLPGVVKGYSSMRKARKRLERIADRTDGEAYLAYEFGHLVGNATVLVNIPEQLGRTSGQLDYWIPGATVRPQTGVLIGQTLIDRALRTVGSAHAWLYDVDANEPSVELKQLMDPFGDSTTDFMAGDADKNAPEETPARLYVAKSTLA